MEDRIRELEEALRVMGKRLARLEHMAFGEEPEAPKSSQEHIPPIPKVKKRFKYRDE